jgi:hypothetical protein
MTRRSFIAALAALPIVGRLVPNSVPSPVFTVAPFRIREVSFATGLPSNCRVNLVRFDTADALSKWIRANAEATIRHAVEAHCVSGTGSRT